MAKLLDEVRHHVGAAADDVLHCLLQPLGVQLAHQFDVQLHTEYSSSVPWAVSVWKSSPCCSGVSGKMSATSYSVANSSIWAWVRRAGAMSEGQAAAVGAYVRADAGQGVEPELAQPADLLAVECRGGVGPVRVQPRAGVGVHGAGVELHGVTQRVATLPALAVSSAASASMRHRSSDNSPAPAPRRPR